MLYVYRRLLRLLHCVVKVGIIFETDMVIAVIKVDILCDDRALIRCVQDGNRSGGSCGGCGGCIRLVLLGKPPLL